MFSYHQAIEYLESFINYEKIAAPYDPRKWKLERMENLLSSLGDPRPGLKFIHVAGTKGKGSTSAMIAFILSEAGFKVGLYTSPHLVSFRERICINGEMISEDQVCELVARLRPQVDEAKKYEDRFGYISFFDVYTTLCLLFFALEKVDFAVMEVGMGGRLDATNVVLPLVSVITQISYDHTISLGNTIEAIATEKVGIIKDNGYVITSPQVPEAMQVIESTCEEKKARLFEVGKDIYFQKAPRSSSLVTSFNVSGILDKYANLHLSLIGDHQLINAATAVGALEILSFHGFNISSEYIYSGLEKVRWPARVEVIRRNPTIVLDVAHNAASAKALRDAIESNFTYEKLIIIIGVAIHKDIKGMGQYLCPIADKFILTKADSPRAMSPEDIKSELAGICDDAVITHDVKSALEKAQAIAGPRDLICITGSLYIAGEVMQILGKQVF